MNEQPPDRLCRVLRGESSDWPPTADEQTALLEAADRHGVGALVYAALSRSDANPPTDRLRARMREEAAAEVLRVAESARVVTALGNTQICTLVFKGGALAHSHYEDSWHRARDDLDLLIAPSDRERASQVLQDLGYAQLLAASGEYVSHQSSFVHVDSRGLQLNVDLHWRLSNPHRYAPCFPFDALWTDRRELPALGPQGYCPNDVDALLIACVHLIAHHHDEVRLIWLLDIHLLVTNLDEDRLDTFGALAQRRDLTAPCQVALALAGQALGTCLPPSVATHWFPPERLAEHQRALDQERGRISIWWSDFNAMSGWRERFAWVRELAFPPPEYMLHRFRTRPWRWLPALYVERAVSGTVRLLRRG